MRKTRINVQLAENRTEAHKSRRPGNVRPSHNMQGTENARLVLAHLSQDWPHAKRLCGGMRHTSQ